MKTYTLPLGFAAALILLTSPHASAQTWDGGGADNNLTTPVNWVGNVAPVANASLIFAGSTRTSPVNDFTPGTVFNLIRFDGAASAFTLSGNRIGVGAANDISGNIRWDGLPGVITQTISADLDLSVGGGGTRSFNAAPNATLLLSGTISGSGAWQKLGLGTLSLTGPNTVTGIVSIQTGTVQISSIGNNSVSSALGAGDSFRVGTGANTATLSLVGSSSAQSSDRQLIVGSGGTAVSTGGAIIRNDNANSAHTLTFVNSTFNVAVGTGGANATRTITLGGINTGNNTIEGSIINQNATTGIIALEKADAGTWVLSGNSTFTGATAVTGGTLSLARVGGPCLGSTASVSVGSGATLLISQSEQVSSSAAVSLSGGTISRASGTSETFGTLNLTADSALDFLSGTAGNMTFGAYEGNTVPSHKLTVNNFFAGNTLVFGSDLGTGGPLSPNIIPASFTGTSFTSTWFNINSTSGGFTSVWNGSTFTITAIPEPSTYVAALGLAGLMLWPLRRRVVALGRIRFR